MYYFVIKVFVVIHIGKVAILLIELKSIANPSWTSIIIIKH